MQCSENVQQSPNTSKLNNMIIYFLRYNVLFAGRYNDGISGYIAWYVGVNYIAIAFEKNCNQLSMVPKTDNMNT